MKWTQKCIRSLSSLQSLFTFLLCFYIFTMTCQNIFQNSISFGLKVFGRHSVLGNEIPPMITYINEIFYMNYAIKNLDIKKLMNLLFNV